VRLTEKQRLQISNGFQVLCLVIVVAFVLFIVYQHAFAWKFDAIRNLTRTIEASPENVPALIERSDVYALLRSYKKSENDLNRVIELQPNNGGYFAKRAHIRLLRGNHAGAKSDLDNARRFSYADGYVHFVLSEYWLTQGDYSNAKDELSSAKSFGFPVDVSFEARVLSASDH
jgi:tetratricopeptide (TPR) repeat protein